MLTPAQWQQYRDVIDLASESFNQDIVTWYRFTRSRQRYGEDASSGEHYDPIPLNTLVGYNIFRVWPMNKESAGGSLDAENIVIILNKKYLENLGYLNSDGFFDMTPGHDYFIHRGIQYRASGETEVSQAGDTVLMFYIVLSREETPTGSDKY